MDCREARLQLDVIRDGGPELDDPAVLSAESHVAACAECAAEVESRRVLDREIAQRIRAVDVPAGLKARLLSAVQEPVVRKADDIPRRRLSRRTWIVGSSLVSLSLLACIAYVSWPREPELLAVDDVQQWWQARVAEHRGLAVNDLPAFDKSFDATVADGRWAGMLNVNGAKGVDLDGDDRHDLVIYPLAETSGGIQGVVLLSAPNRVTDLPAVTSALDAERQYTPLEHVAWTTTDKRLCVCVVTAGTRADPLRSLLDAVYSQFG